MEPQTRQLLAKLRTDLPEWEVTLSGVKIGRIQRVKIGKSSSVFFHAYGVHPDTRREYSLESSTDFDDRVRVIAAFWADPGSSVHFRQWS
jgi:hypothetical protein